MEYRKPELVARSASTAIQGKKAGDQQIDSESYVTTNAYESDE